MRTYEALPHGRAAPIFAHSRLTDLSVLIKQYRTRQRHVWRYLHLVINWLEVAATSEFIGRVRACAVAETQRTYRWIYRTVLRDWTSWPNHTTSGTAWSRCAARQS